MMIELPFLNSMPPIAGSKAKANGAECHADESWPGSEPTAPGFGSSRSSVDDLKDFRTSLSEYSLKLELRLRVARLEASVALRLMPGVGGSKVAARRLAESRWRNWELSSPVRTLRRGVPAEEVGFGSSGIGVLWTCLG